VRRITGAGELWTVGAEDDYGGPIFHVVLIIELRDGKILRETRYYAGAEGVPADLRAFRPSAWTARSSRASPRSKTT
jgi:hypothetical protein